MLAYIILSVFTFGIIGSIIGILCESLSYGAKRSVITLTVDIVKGLVGGFVIGSLGGVIVGGIIYNLFQI